MKKEEIKYQEEPTKIQKFLYKNIRRIVLFIPMFILVFYALTIISNLLPTKFDNYNYRYRKLQNNLFEQYNKKAEIIKSTKSDVFTQDEYDQIVEAIDATYKIIKKNTRTESDMPTSPDPLINQFEVMKQYVKYNSNETEMYFSCSQANSRLTQAYKRKANIKADNLESLGTRNLIELETTLSPALYKHWVIYQEIYIPNIYTAAYPTNIEINYLTYYTYLIDTVMEVGDYNE